VWGSLRSALASLLRWARRAQKDRRTTAERERFWSEVREGEREAESRARP
jgi:type IV secretory pathway TrbL component